MGSNRFDFKIEEMKEFSIYLLLQEIIKEIEKLEDSKVANIRHEIDNLIYDLREKVEDYDDLQRALDE